MSQLSHYHWTVDILPYREDWTPLESAKNSCLFQLCNLFFKTQYSQGNTSTNKIKVRELAVTVSPVNCQKENKTKLFHMVFIFIKCFFFPLLRQRYSECWLIWCWRTQYDFIISHAICKTAKKWRLHFAEKMFLPKQNNLLLSIFCVSFARHYLTIFSLWKRKDF